MPPDITPHGRHPAGIVPTGNYLPDERVWIYRDGSWRPGVIDSTSARAVTVTYRLTGTPGTGVDTVTAPYVLHRTEPDALVDRRTAAPGPARRPRTATPRPNYPSWRHTVS